MCASRARTRLTSVQDADLCYTKSHVNTFVNHQGDSIFAAGPLRENAKQVIGVGVKHSRPTC